MKSLLPVLLWLICDTNAFGGDTAEIDRSRVEGVPGESARSDVQ